VKKDYQQDLIRYRIERARETFEEALLMQREKHWNSCANRLYYACFYTVTAVLVKKGLASSKHRVKRITISWKMVASRGESQSA
jgi:uncharacterized protein (UPF0332 family)